MDVIFGNDRAWEDFEPETILRGPHLSTAKRMPSDRTPADMLA